MKAAAAVEQLVESNGVRLWTQRHGEGPPLVLLHGGPGLWDYFDELAEMVDDIVEVRRYDQRGGGRSEAVPPYDVATFVADLEALRAHWSHERWVVAGHSAGANLALAYGLAHPLRVEALIYIDGTGVIEDWQDEYHANADTRRTPEQRARRAELRALLEASDAEWTSELEREYCVLTWMADFADRERAPQFAEQLLHLCRPSYEVNEALNADWTRLLADGSFADRVRGIDAPALVVHGADDPRPARLAERLARSLPNARLAIVPQAGHLPWLERPAEIREALRGFLDGLVVANGASVDSA